MSKLTVKDEALKWDVFITPGIPIASPSRPAGVRETFFQAMAYLVESSVEKRQEWIAALNRIESLGPRAVVASHKRPENDDSPRIIEETRGYIRDFDRLAGITQTAQELYEQMLALYPTRVNPGWALWNSARAVKP